MTILTFLLMIIILRMGFIMAYFFVYNTNRYSKIDSEYDCIDYQISGDIVLYNIKSVGVSQSIRYCIRPSYMTDDQILITDTNSLRRSYKNFTFEELRVKRKMNPNDLISMPGYTSIDDIERYTIYFETSNESMSQEQIYRCEGTWFGPECQYNFNIRTPIHTTLELADSIYLGPLIWERSSNISLLQMTCHTHLICNRGPPPACLDWREICDGKIDCGNDGGIDEHFCEQFENFECNTNEYRCQNGRQCIPQEFYHDDPLNPDCQDGSDEILQQSDMPLTYPNECDRDPAFRCEERTCPPNEFACGDGQCVQYLHECYNHRGQLLMMEFAIYFDKKTLLSCQSLPISCGTHIKDVEECEQSCWSKTLFLCNAKLGQSCISTVFKHSPAAFRPNHDMYIFYDYNMVPSKRRWVIVPHDHCFNDTYCYNTEIYPDNPSYVWCQRQKNQMQLSYVDSYSRSDFTATIQRLTKICYKRSINSNSNGEVPNRYETKGRFIDFESIASEIRDDPLQTHREQQHEPEKNKWNKNFPFFKLCDRNNDLSSTVIDDIPHTDETECDDWPCNSIYTRCDGHANCPNSADESVCTKTHCQNDEFLCISVHSNTTECLSNNRIRNSKIDCISGIDEYMKCNVSSDPTFRQFLCSSNDKCIDERFVCDGVAHCAGREDEYLCESFAITMILPMLGCVFSVASIDVDFMILSCFNSIIKSIGFLSMMNINPYPFVKPEILPKNLRLKRTDDTQHQFNKDVISKNIIRMPQENSPFYCHRGLDTYVATNDKKRFERKCFCPPSYYGNQCQYQSDRVSLTLRMRFAFNQRSAFVFLIILTDEKRHINSFITHKHHPSEDCNTKFNYYLVYSSFIKNKTTNYFIHIDLFKQEDLSYYASWQLSINHPFLPVTRISVLLRIPTERILPVENNYCSIKCQHGQCMKYVNIEKYFCQCKPGWYGLLCDTRHRGDCSSNSLYMGSANNRPICICPADKFGPRCLFKNPCQTGVCENGGTCISLVDLKHGREGDKYRCVCTNEFEGRFCEQRKTAVSFQFVGIQTYPFMIIHIFSKFTNTSRTHMITFKKLRVNSNKEDIFISSDVRINLIFVQFDTTYYLVVVQENNRHSFGISTVVSPKRQCYPIHDLLNSTLVQLHPLRRLKHYPRLCFEQRDLVCFHDERFMCLCTADHFSNCFEFDYNKKCTCQNENPCEKEGRCLEDRPECPSIVQCICSECYYGTRCQFSTGGLGVSLDAILGYEIQPRYSFFKQSMSVRITAIITSLMFACGLLSSVLSLITFRQGEAHTVGCGKYLLAASIASLLTIIMFTLKFWFLLLSQMSVITHPKFLFINCLLMDVFTNVCLGISNWLGACVAVERTVNIIRQIKFNTRKSKKVAIWVIFILIVCVILSHLSDPLHRVLLHDESEQRIWCIVRYPPSVETFNSINIFFHFIVPFTINAISAIIIIMIKARTRFTAKKEQSYLQHLLKQLDQFKHLLISPSVLVLLSVPRLILAFMPGCMKSTEDPWIYLAGYFISFVPPVLIFPIFVLPSRLYREEFTKETKRLFKKMTKLYRCHQ